jgi:2-polyprenyl-3-methyl-5-hydroxy-6-metoxy-1,4-benzoquinol methylase
MSNIHHNHTKLFLKSFNSLSQISNSKVLDMGCGDGFASSQFLLHGAATVHAYDPFKLAPELCSDLNIPYYSQITQLDSDYDIVWMHHVLEHVPDYLALLQDIRSRLKDTGWLWMAVPNMANHTVFSPGHINNFMAPQLVEILRLAEFGIKDMSIWAHQGQLRIRVPKLGMLQYPQPMLRSIKDTGRCPSELLNKWNW